MISIVQRYLIVEILKSSLAITFIMFAILMSNTLGSVLSEVSRGDIPLEAVIPVMLGHSIKELSAITILGFFLGVIFAFGKLYKDHELVVLHACGFGYRQLYIPVLIIMLPFVLVTASSSIWLSSMALQRAKNIVDESKNIHEFQRLKVGQFNESDDKKQVFYMRSISADKLEIEDVIITQKDPKQGYLEIAGKGRHQVDNKTGDLFLEVGPGKRYEGKAGDADYQIIDFDTHGILLQKKQSEVDALNKEEKYFHQLFEANNRVSDVEILWRINIPFSLIILGVLAVPLSYIAPRKGRYGRTAVALLVYLAYINTLGINRKAMETGDIPMWLNFWWIHLLFFALALFLLSQRTRVNPLKFFMAK